MAVISNFPTNNKQIMNLLSDKQNKLVGQPGQIVGFGVDGAAQTVQGWSNPNLLDNWYFADPVNQRGSAGYTTSWGYTIDRWNHSRSTITVEENGIGMVWDGTNANGLLFEYIPLERIGPDQEYTFSALVKGIGLISVTASALSVPPSDYTTLAFSLSAAVRLEIAEGSSSGNYWMQCSIRTYNTEKWVVQAAKLELGPVQTLAHQDADGNWVLNDPPPNKALELEKCQKYAIAMDGAEVRASRVTANAVRAFFPTPHSLRANPAITKGAFQVKSLSSGNMMTNAKWTVMAFKTGILITATLEGHGQSDCTIFSNGVFLSSDL